MDTWVYRVSAKHLTGWSWIADFAYRWDAERFIADHPARKMSEYWIDALTAHEAAKFHRDFAARLAGGSRF